MNIPKVNGLTARRRAASARSVCVIREDARQRRQQRCKFIHEGYVVITGANGQLGSVLTEVLANHSRYTIIALDKNQLDITSPSMIETVFAKYQPKWVINTAAFTAVDDAEIKPEQAFILNATAVEYLAKQCVKNSAKLIHFSTDYVFDGKKQGGYLEEDICDPQTVYGKSKLAGEQVLRDILEDHINLRISWVFSTKRNNFVKATIQALKEKPFIKIVNDQYGCPTSAESIARVVKNIIENYPGLRGTYHYANKPAVSRYDFSLEIQKQLVEHYSYEEKQIYPVSSKEFAARANRPLNSQLICTKLLNELNLAETDWRDELKKVVEELHSAVST